MIVVYPMLSSENVSQHLIPGICKVLERYILVYKTDEIFKLTKPSIIQQLPITAKVPFMGNESKNSFLTENGKKEKKEEKDKKGKKKEFLSLTTGKTNIKIDAKVDQPNKSDVLVEPTYVTLNTKLGPQLVGVKVLPYPVKNTSKKNVPLSTMMTSDRSIGFFKAILSGIGRSIVRRLYSLYRSTIGKIPLLAPSISGDIRKDMIFASTSHKQNIFLLLNSSDFPDGFFNMDPKDVKQLFYMGWGSIIVIDDVNRVVKFCMKEFSGLCSTIPYSYIFSSLGRDRKSVV